MQIWFSFSTDWGISFWPCLVTESFYFLVENHGLCGWACVPMCVWGGMPLWVSVCAHVCRGHAYVGEHVCTCVCGGMLLSNSFSLKEAPKEKLNNSFSLIKFIKLLSSFDLMAFLDLKVISKFFPDNVKKEKNDVIVYVGSGDVLYLFHAIQIVSREFFRFKKKITKIQPYDSLAPFPDWLKGEGFLVSEEEVQSCTKWINKSGKGEIHCVLKCAVDPHHAANACRDWVFKRRPTRPWLTGPIDFLGFCRHRFPASQRPHVGGQGAPGRSEPALATSQSEGLLKENQSCHKWEASKIFSLYGQGPSACLRSVAKVSICQVRLGEEY